jgi:ribulose-phosphate 3-epimerase
MIAPSILNSDFLHLGKEIKMINESASDWIHMDVMDGSFVPNISFGIPVVESVSSISQKPLDVHLMIVNPEKYLEDFKNAGAAILNVHYEACRENLVEVIEEIRRIGCKAAFTINPDTEVSDVLEYVHLVDMVLVMSVFPGFGGQKFIEATYDRISQLKSYIEEHQLETLIQVDGGVNDKNAGKLYAAGADVLVVGSFIFRSESPVETIANIRSQANKVRA